VSIDSFLRRQRITLRGYIPWRIFSKETRMTTRTPSTAPAPAGEVPLGGGSAPEPNYVDDPMRHLRDEQDEQEKPHGEVPLGGGSARLPKKKG
jgi:hypothetical protein